MSLPAELVPAWWVVPDEDILHDGRVCRVTATAQLATRAAKSFEFTIRNEAGGKPYKRFRVRRSDLIARVTGGGVP